MNETFENTRNSRTFRTTFVTICVNYFLNYYFFSLVCWTTVSSEVRAMTSITSQNDRLSKRYSLWGGAHILNGSFSHIHTYIHLVSPAFYFTKHYTISLSTSFRKLFWFNLLFLATPQIYVCHGGQKLPKPTTNLVVSQ